VKILLDTHTFIWMVTAPDELSVPVREAFADASHQVWFSAAISWEIAVKRAKGKLEFSGSPLVMARRLGLPELAMTAEHAELSGDLPLYHRDPFDRLLIAQAQVEGLVLATRDTALARYGIRILGV
jgi:PIN domain nuclease of toxin-antitoxin system